MGREADHQTQPSAEVKKKVQLCCYAPLGLQDLSQDKPYHTVYCSVTLHLVLKSFSDRFYENSGENHLKFFRLLLH